MSARSILSAIDREKYEVVEIGITHEGRWVTGDNTYQAAIEGHLDLLNQAALLPDPTAKGLYYLEPADIGTFLKEVAQLDVIFPVLHGSYGEDGTIQGLFEMVDLAYVGAGVLGSSLGMDKAVFKTIMRACNIPVVDWIIASRKEIEQDINKVIKQASQLGDYPFFVKPANLGSSVGVTKCLSNSDLIEGLLEASRFDRRVLVELGVNNAREIEVSVLGNYTPQVSIPGEIIPSREFYSYEAKYIDSGSQLLIPAPIPDEMVEKVKHLALKAYQAIDCSGMARVDFLLEQSSPGGNMGKLYLSELNTIPGFTKISMYPKLWEASGLSYPALIDRLIALALERKLERDQTERRFKEREI